ncbi:hypothetical protein VXQ18_06885 [Brucella abortus]|nr:hypothetical protein [Brucella abortus]
MPTAIPQYLALEPRDRALVRAILGSALRNRGSIERAINKRLDRPLPENAVALKHSAPCCRRPDFLSRPARPFGSVDLAVEAANSDPRNRKYAGLVNALLRRLARNKERALAHTVEPEANVLQNGLPRASPTPMARKSSDHSRHARL